MTAPAPTDPRLTPRDLHFLSHLTGDPKSTADLMLATGATNPNVNSYMRRLEALGLATCTRKGAKGRYPGLWVRTGAEPSANPPPILCRSRSGRERSPKFNAPSRFAAKVTAGAVTLRVVRVDSDGNAQPIDVTELAQPPRNAMLPADPNPSLRRPKKRPREDEEGLSRRIPGAKQPVVPEWMRKPAKPPTRKADP